MTIAKRTIGVAVAAALSLAAGLTSAQELTIGLGASVTSLDPHFHALGPNNNIASHVFNSLVEQDENQRLVPGLAVSWTPREDDTWVIKLRPGVKFHDGSDFTAEDVIASVKRVPWVPNSPSNFTIYTKAIKNIVVVDPLTIELKTDGPYPLMPNDLSNFFIVNKKMVEAPTEDFNRLAATIGTGPYRFVDYARGDRIVMERNDAYWGKKPEWKKVTFRLITNPAARVAALLAGDVQMIEAVPTADIEKLKANAALTLAQAASNRLIYLHMDHQREVTPFIADTSGKPLAKNPLKDLRVRQALSKALNRDGIVERVMEGVAVPAGQLLADSFFGTSPNLRPEKFDPDGAKKLLADAGFPNGFAITIHGPNDRYINDGRIIQTIAQMWSRIGIEAKVEALPWATFATKATNQEFTIYLVGWGSGTGETSSTLRSLLATFNRDTGMGQANRGRYSNPELDKVLAEALKTVDDKKRGELLAKASEIGVRDVGIIPLHYEVSTWAMKKGLKYVARADQQTMAMEVTTAK
ncbi:MAG: ABC transporter substrate-binding protein [Alphaproteobacteria bacterium]|nr:ABC transporter substrate-binding protein [Alphaproteobacteria bacterium]